MEKSIHCPCCCKAWDKECDENQPSVPDFFEIYWEKLCPSCLEIFRKNVSARIHREQIAGNFEPCFGTKESCDQGECSFRRLCLGEHHKVKKPASPGVFSPPAMFSRAQ